MKDRYVCLFWGAVAVLFLVANLCKAAHPLQDKNGDFPARVAVRNMDLAQPAARCVQPNMATPAVADISNAPPAVAPVNVQDGYWTFCPRGRNCPPQQPQVVAPPQFDFAEDEEEVEPKVEVLPIEPSVPAWLVVLASSISVVVGAAAGVYTQWKSTHK